MKKLLFYLLFLLFTSCTKTEIKEIVREVNMVPFKDSTYIRFFYKPLTSKILPKYVVIDFEIAYKISNNYLSMSGGGFKIYNTLLIDDIKTEFIWSSKQLRFREDTLTFKYESQQWLPKSSIKFYSEIAQMNTSTDWYSIAVSDTLKYSVKW